MLNTKLKINRREKSRLFLSGKVILTLFFSAIVLSFAFQSDKKDTKDYLGIAGPVIFYGTNYYFSESQHTLLTNYTQRYLPEGDNPERFDKMIFFTVNKTALSLNDWANKKVKDIENRKKTDLVAQDSLIDLKETNEYVLVTTTSVGDKRDKKVVEWNVYRYKVCMNEGKRFGIITFAYSQHAYGDDIYMHFNYWHAHSADIIKEVEAFTIPQIKSKL